MFGRTFVTVGFIYGAITVATELTNDNGDVETESFQIPPTFPAYPKLLGCFNTTEYMVEKNFSKFLSRRVEGQRSSECLQWCLSQNTRLPPRSIIMLHQDNCICSGWTPPLLPFLDFNEVDDRYCVKDEKNFGIEPWTERIVMLYIYCQLQLHVEVSPDTKIAENAGVITSCAVPFDVWYPSATWTFTDHVGTPGQTPVLEGFRKTLETVRRTCEDHSEEYVKSTVVNVYVTMKPRMGSTRYVCQGLAYDAPLEHDFWYEDADLKNCQQCPSLPKIPSFETDHANLYYCGGKPKLPDDVTLVSIYIKRKPMLDICGHCDTDFVPEPTSTTKDTPVITGVPFPTVEPGQTTQQNSRTSAETEFTATTTPDLTTTTTDSDGRDIDDPGDMTTMSFPASTAASGIPNRCESAHCNAFDTYGTEWCGNIDQTVTMPCPGNSSGTVSWTCTKLGFDQDQVDYSNCKSTWYQELTELVQASQSVSPDCFTHCFLMIHQKCKQSVEQGTSQQPPPYYPHEIIAIFDLSAEIIVKVDKTVSIKVYEEMNYYGIDVMRQIFVNQNPWNILGRRPCAQAGTAFVLGVESAVLELTSRVASNNSWMSEHIYYKKNYGRFEMNMTCGTQVIFPTQNESICYPCSCNDLSGSYIRLPANWAQYFEGREDVQFAGMELMANYTNKVFPACLASSELLQRLNDTSVVVNGNMMTFSVDSTLPLLLGTSLNFTGDEGVTIRIQHELMAWGDGVKKIRRTLHPGEAPAVALGTATCVYWDTAAFSWSDDGCEVVSTDRHYTVCKCYHLSSFAVLFSAHDYIGKNRILEILTWILSTLSSFSLAICLVILCLSKTKSVRSPRNEITVHLCVNLLAGNIAILLFMDKNYLHLGQTICAISGVMIHFFFLSAFCWMTIEAIQLYRLVIVVFDNGQDYKLTQRLVAYGIPTLTIIFTLITGVMNAHFAYGGDEFCWLQGSYIWAFMGPVAFLLTINFGVLVLSLKKVQKLNAGMKHQLGKRRIRSWMKGTASLTCLLGLCWISGFFMVVSSNPVVAEIFAFLFTILNSSQGFLLFVFHFAMNCQVQAQIKLKLCQWLPWVKKVMKSQNISTIGSSCSSSTCSNKEFFPSGIRKV